MYMIKIYLRNSDRIKNILLNMSCFSVEAKPTTLESLQPHAQSDCPAFEVNAMQCGYLDEME